MKPFIFLAVALASCQAQAKSVWAHFMVSNTKGYTPASWEAEMVLARDAKIDGFALNMGWNEETNGESLDNAFKAAANLGNGFKLFFSLDYAGNGAWPQSNATAIINKYKNHAAYFKFNGKPLVSTFEGPASASEWKTIKPDTGAFFIPSYSSLGAKKAVETGVVDGLFSWGAWQEGPNDNYNTVDESYLAFLGGKPYMMPVSPWFYTNMPGFRKNWLWRGDDLWYDRWVSVLSLQPEFVQIITWNDYGESHYIGPLRSTGYEAFGKGRGKAPFNYALNMPHDGWRLFLPYWIDMYKTGTATVTREGVVAWYRQAEALLCPPGGTTGNTATQLQFTHQPEKLLRDKVFFDALLGSYADVSVTIGGVDAKAKWENVPDGNVGIFHGSVDFKGLSGPVVVTITRGGATVVQMTGQPIRNTCINGIQNWNCCVGSKQAAGTIAAKSPPANSLKHCVQGRGLGYYEGLCRFACEYDYCPPVCTCTARASKPKTRPAYVDVHGCPADGFDETFLGLCSMTCGLGYCSPTACSVKPAGYVCPRIPVKAPPVPNCIAGTAEGPYKELCEFGCKYNECPPDLCMCTGVGYGGPDKPPKTSVTGTPLSGKDYGLCDWACSHGFCDAKVCKRFPPLALPVTSLTKESSCKDQENYKKDVEPSFWDMVKAGEVLSEWFEKNKGTGNWLADFATPLSVGQSSACAMDDDCNRPNCANLGVTTQTEAQSAAKLQILMSMSNFHKYLKTMRAALLESELRFAATSAWVLTSYWKRENPLDDTTKQWFNGINTGVGVVNAAGGPVGGPLGALTNGVLTGVQLGMDKPIEFSDLAELEMAARGLFNKTAKELENAHVGLFGSGAWEGSNIQDILAKGAFLDYRTVPIINTAQSGTDIKLDVGIVTKTELVNLVYLPILGSIINTAWRRQGLILMAYPMTRAEFDKIEILGDEFGLRYWDPPVSGDVGKGYFYQSWRLDRKQGYGATDMVTHVWPLGYEKLAESGIGWEDPLVSSIEAYKIGGLNYEQDNTALFSGLTRSKTKLDKPTKIAGVFNIPVCEISRSVAETYEDFAELLSGRGGSFGLGADMMMKEWPG